MPTATRLRHSVNSITVTARCCCPAVSMHGKTWLATPCTRHWWAFWVRVENILYTVIILTTFEPIECINLPPHTSFPSRNWLN